MPSRLFRIEAIVIKQRNFGEADRLVTFFSKQAGKIRALAKGVRKITSRRSGHLEVFSHVIATLHQGKKFDYITEVVRTSGIEVTAGLPKLAGAYYACELIDRLLPERQEHLELYELFRATLIQINQSQEATPQVRLYTFSVELLHVLGYLPPAKWLPPGEVDGFIEQILEGKLHTPKILTTTYGKV